MNSADLIAATPGLTYRMLDFWCHKGVFGDRVSAGSGSGYRRNFTAQDLAIARVLARFSVTFGEWTGRRGGPVEIYRAIADQMRSGNTAVAIVELGGGVTLSVDVREGIDA